MNVLTVRENFRLEDGILLGPAGNQQRLNLAPSRIEPTIQYIKSSERSLGGKLHVDIAGFKQALQIVFDVLNQNELHRIKYIFQTDMPDQDGISVVYNDITIPNAKYFVENITYTPLVIEDSILWQNVTLSLVEV